MILIDKFIKSYDKPCEWSRKGIKAEKFNREKNFLIFKRQGKVYESKREQSKQEWRQKKEVKWWNTPSQKKLFTTLKKRRIKKNFFKELLKRHDTDRQVHKKVWYTMWMKQKRY
jgi:hypothetical protein